MQEYLAVLNRQKEVLIQSKNTINKLYAVKLAQLKLNNATQTEHRIAQSLHNQQLVEIDNDITAVNRELERLSNYI